MADFTLDQQKAIAMASARARMAGAGGTAAAPTMGPKDVPDSVPEAQRQPFTLEPSALDLARGVPGAVLAAGSSIPAQVAGRATSLLGEATGLVDPSAGPKVTEALTYEPSDRAKAALEAFGKVMDKTKLAGLGPMGAEIPAGAPGTTKFLSKDVSPKVAAARKAGFSMTPTEGGGGLPSRIAEGLSGEPNLAKGVSKKNVAVATEKIVEDLGLPKGTPLSAENLRGVEEKAWGAYEAVRKVGTVKADEVYEKALDALKEKFVGASNAFPEAAKKLAIKDTEELIDAFRKPSFDSGATLDMIKALREAANEAYVAGKGGYAKVARGIADTLEDQIGRHVEGSGMPANIVSDFQSARTTLAKVHEARKALTGGEHINPQAYARTLAKSPNKLTGKAKEVGQFAADFPRSAQKMPQGSVGAPTWSDMILGSITGGGSILAHGLSMGATLPAAAAIAARPVTRWLLASPVYQKWLGAQGSARVPIPSVSNFRSPLQIAPILPQSKENEIIDRLSS